MTNGTLTLSRLLTSNLRFAAALRCGLKTMQITIDLPDNLSLTESDLRREVAIALFQQNILLIEQAAQVIAMNVDDFNQILVDRGILTPQATLTTTQMNSSLLICESPYNKPKKAT